MKPLLKWAGGKSWHVDAIRTVYRPGRRLVEPFAGGLAISLGIEPARCLVNDINPHLINFYRQVRDQYPFQTAHLDPAMYYAMREAFNKAERPDGEMAELFFALNHWCFNGLWRVNKSGAFNVPARPVMRALPAPDWRAYSELFNCWEFKCGDFAQLQLSETDFLYCDPPYYNTFATYDKSGFTIADHERLARWAKRHPGPVCIMNSDNLETRAMYLDHGFFIEGVAGNQRMQKSRGRADKIGEIMAFNDQFSIDRAQGRVHDHQETLQ